MASCTTSSASSASRNATCAMRNARRSISAKNFSSSLVYSRTAPSGAGAGPSQTIQAVLSVSKRAMRIISIQGINAYPQGWLTPRTAQDQQLTHIACDSRCNIFDRYLGAKSSGGRNPLNLKESIRFRVFFHQFDTTPKQNGHLG